jgi:hypothetical protein
MEQLLSFIQSLFPLPIFPEGLTYSLLTPVLVGVLFMALSTETFGGGFSGLVVPGYLAPIFLLKPWIGLVIVLEAVVTYLIVRLTSDGGCRLALVITGTLVRVLAEGYVLPAASLWLGDVLAAQLDLRGNLHSIGLICVPLLANMFWKTGVLDGIPPVMLPMAATYLTLRFVLMPFTNFSVGHIEVAYDSFAVDLVANPKSYIVLMTSMVMASRAALRYGWDFNGVMVPALISLTWFEPQKLVSTFVESYLIYQVTRRMLKLKLFENITVEGPRKVLSGFLIGYSLKFIACMALSRFAHGFNPIDLFGFGYMLPTLIAVKMIQKENAALVLGPTLLVSAQGALWGNAAGFLLMLTVPAASFLGLQPAAATTASVEPLAETPVSSVQARLTFDRRLVLPEDALNRFQRPWPVEENAFTLAMTATRRAMEAQSSWEQATLELGQTLPAVSMAASLLATGPGASTYLSEATRTAEWPRGHGLFVFRRHPTNRLVLQVPHPLQEPGAAEAGAWLYERLGAAALMVAGAHPRTNVDRSADVLVNPRTLFQAAHRVFRSYDVVSLRVQAQPGARLLCAGEVPDALDFERLTAEAGRIELGWDRLPGRHCQAESAAGGFANLLLTPASVERLRAGAFGTGPLPALEGTLAQLLGLPRTPPSAAPPAPPTTALLHFLDVSVLTPLVSLAAAESVTAVSPARWREVDSAAGLAGYRLAHWSEPATTGPPAVLLQPAPGSPRRWGTFVLRAGPAQPLLLEVPEPAVERRTGETGAALFQALRARALLVNDGQDPARPRDAVSFFHLAHQVLAREAGPAQPFLAVQLRGFRTESHPGVTAEMIVSPGRETSDDSPRYRRFAEQLTALGHTVAMQDSSLELSPFRAAWSPEEAYSVAFHSGPFAYLHVSDQARENYRITARTAEEENWSLAYLEAIGIPRVQGSLADRLARPRATSPAASCDPAALRDLMVRFSQSQNPLLLSHANAQATACGGRLEHFTDRASGVAILLAELPDRWLLVNPRPRNAEGSASAPEENAIAALGQFLARGDLVLELTGHRR